jgi:hypothetical protein
LANAIVAEGSAKWKVTTVLRDIEASLVQVGDPAKRTRLSAIVDRIKAI